jgi:hypothetical protein
LPNMMLATASGNVLGLAASTHLFMNYFVNAA